MRSKKFQMNDQAKMSTTQEATEHQFLKYLSKHLVKPGLYFVSIPNGWPCKWTLSPNSKWRRRYLSKGNCNKNILLYCAIIDVICAIFFCYEGSACITCLPHNSWLFEPAFHHHHDIKVFSSQITRPPFSKWGRKQL